MKRPEGKAAAIAGAASGIGRATARLFAGEGGPGAGGRPASLPLPRTDSPGQQEDMARAVLLPAAVEAGFMTGMGWLQMGPDRRA